MLTYEKEQLVSAIYNSRATDTEGHGSEVCALWDSETQRETPYHANRRTLGGGGGGVERQSKTTKITNFSIVNKAPKVQTLSATIC